MITEEYIKMCEMGIEMQRAWRPKDMDIFCYTQSREIGEACVDNKKRTQKEWDENLKHQFWLPTLEQLFEMVINYKNRGYDIGGILLGINIFADENTLGGLHIKELIIRWVMHEKYNKSWNGKKWEATK